jgi:nuclear migration protein JNM1
LDKAAAASQAAAKRGQTGGGEEVKSVLELGEKEKIDALFALVGRIDPILPVVSPLLLRLRSLSTLHASAAGFDTMLRQLESKMDGLGDGDVEEVMKRVGNGLKTQSEAVKANWSSLEERLDDVERRLKDVHG